MTGIHSKDDDTFHPQHLWGDVSDGRQYIVQMTTDGAIVAVLNPYQAEVGEHIILDGAEESIPSVILHNSKAIFNRVHGSLWVRIV